LSEARICLSPREPTVSFHCIGQHSIAALLLPWCCPEGSVSRKRLTDRARVRHTRLLRDQVSGPSRLAWLRATASLQCRRALLSSKDLRCGEHGNPHQPLVTVATVPLEAPLS